jgi:hypothetical protein
MKPTSIAATGCRVFIPTVFSTASPTFVARRGSIQAPLRNASSASPLLRLKPIMVFLTF